MSFRVGGQGRYPRTDDKRAPVGARNTTATPGGCRHRRRRTDRRGLRAVDAVRDFPRFMNNIKEVRQLDDSRLLWTAEVAGREHSWEAKILEQEPNRRVTWRATEGLQNSAR